MTTGNGAHRISADWIAVGFTALTLAAQLGAWVWWGGRLSQRVDMLEMQMKQEQTAHEYGRDTNSRQDAELAVAKQQYMEIKEMLNRIYSKLDAFDEPSRRVR